MKISGRESNEVILKELGERIKAKRIALSITQKELADRAGVSVRTIGYAENGENTSLSHIISILRVLKVAENLDILIPETKTNPMDILQFGHKRERVSKTKKQEKSDWKWGEDK